MSDSVGPGVGNCSPSEDPEGGVPCDWSHLPQQPPAQRFTHGTVIFVGSTGVPSLDLVPVILSGLCPISCCSSNTAQLSVPQARMGVFPELGSSHGPSVSPQVSLLWVNLCLPQKDRVES